MIVNQLTKTRPGLLHANGEWVRPNELWKRVKEWFFSNDPRMIGESREITVLTANNGDPGMGLFEKGLRHLGIPYVSHGVSVRADHWENAVHKIRAIRAGLEEIATKYVLFADSKDCLLLVTPEELLARFLSTDRTGLLFGAEMIAFPQMEAVQCWEDHEADGSNAGPFRYLNSGAWIGETGYAKEFFAAVDQSSACPEVPWSEQGKIRRYRLHHAHEPIAVDYRCELFQNNVNDRNQFLAVG